MNAASPSLELGSVLAERYRLDRVLGKGGMGAVYEGYDLRLRRSVAVKVILPHRIADADAVARFMREARAAAALSHPNITTVHDVGQSEMAGGVMPFLVMERLEGEPLSARIARRPMSVAEATELAVVLLDALSVAHDAGVVHRDIKPDNVFLCAPEGRPMLVDFGVARMLERNPDDPPLTEQGQSLGTPLYMAPEQVEGAAAGPAADLYAVAAVLYEAVAARPIYEAQSFAALAAHKVTRDPDVEPLRRACGSGPFFDTVTAALARDPASRPASARAMADALQGRAGAPAASLADTVSADGTEGAAAARAATAQAAPTPEHVGSPRRRGGGRGRLALLLAGAAAGVIGLAALGVAAFGLDGRIVDVIGGTGTGGTGSLEEPTRALRLLHDYHHGSGATRTLLQSPDRWQQCVDDLERALEQRGPPLRWRSALPFCRGVLHLQRAEPQQAVDELTEATELEPEWPDPWVQLGHARMANGDTEGAIGAVHEASRLAPDWWVPVAALGSIHGRAGKDDEAIQAYRRALAMEPKEPRILDALALTYHAQRIDGQARKYAKRTLKLDPEAPWSHLIEAERHLESGDGEAALDSAERTVSVHPRSPAAVLAHADALALLGRQDEAREGYERVLELVGQERATGLPEGRLAEVRSAVDEDRLPTPRHELAERAQPARAAPAAEAASGRSKPRRSRPRREGGSGSSGDPGRSLPDDVFEGY